MPESVEIVSAGYDTVYAGVPKSPTFARLWRQHALGEGFPAGFEHISFLDLDEMRWVSGQLALPRGGTLADLGCGMGGPGLWLAREAGAQLAGVDLSEVALGHARARAATLGVEATFERGTFAATRLADASADGATTFDALQYAPDKRAALAEAARILKPGSRFVFSCFELEPARVAGLPVLGDDPVADYRPLLDSCGFDVVSYAEAVDWERRLTATYQAVIDAKNTLAAEMGEAATTALTGEIGLTLQLHPYRRRVLASAQRR